MLCAPHGRSLVFGVRAARARLACCALWLQRDCTVGRGLRATGVGAGGDLGLFWCAEPEMRLLAYWSWHDAAAESSACVATVVFSTSCLYYFEIARDRVTGINMYNGPIVFLCSFYDVYVI